MRLGDKQAQLAERVLRRIEPSSRRKTETEAIVRETDGEC